MIKKRIFIVGIARSGTTLLQSIIGNHKIISTFPESHFFDRSIPKQKWLRLFYKHKPEHDELILNFLQEIDLANLYNDFKGKPGDLNAWVQHIIKIYDAIANSENKVVWLEKTPLHLYYTHLIEKNTSNVEFLHIVREPIANIAALYDVSKKYPESFSQTTIEKATKRYITETSITERLISKPNHHLVHYEDILHNPEKTINEVCEKIGIPFYKELLNYQDTAKKVKQSDETWKQNNVNTIKKQDKINERLTNEEVEYVHRQIKKLNAKILDYYND